jgi:hypothetical protein
MQFFILSPFFVLAYKYNEWIGMLVACGVCLLSCVLAFVDSLQYNWSAHSFDGMWVTEYTMYAYTKPQYRIASYAVGIAAAMAWHTKQRRWPDFTLSVVAARVTMVLALLGSVVLVFGAVSAYQLQPCNYYQSSTAADPCGSNWSLLARAWYVGFTRALWAICIGLIVLLSGNDQGELVQGFLSHAVWGPPAKLTFAVYLIHITVLNVWIYGKGEKLHFTMLDFYMSFAGVVFVSFLASLVVTVLVESPWTLFAKSIEKNLSAAFIKSRLRDLDKLPTTAENLNGRLLHENRGDGLPNYSSVAGSTATATNSDCATGDFELAYHESSTLLSGTQALTSK